MTTNPNDLINPTTLTAKSSDSNGLTKREYFAAKAMQGILSTRDPAHYLDAVYLAKHSCRFADALIEQLNKSDKL